jgi:hypothetical protein
LSATTSPATVTYRDCGWTFSLLVISLAIASLRYVKARTEAPNLVRKVGCCVVDNTKNLPQGVLAGLLGDSVSQRYPGRFEAEQVEALRQAIEPIVETIATLRKYRLTNADEPDPVFRAYQGDG